MVEFLFAQANLPFSISLSFVLLLGIFEALSLVLGYSLVGAMDDWAPIDLDVDADGSASGFTGVSGWLCLNRLPLLIWFVLVLVSFSITGYTSNFLSLLLADQPLPQIISLPIALILTAFSCRYVGAAVAKVLPKNESTAVSIDTLLGSIGTVTLGCAIKGNPSEALVKDQHQQKHYVLVEPEVAGVEFQTGTQVVLLKREGTVWSAAKFDS
ncbi:YqiJ family protein [Shewanella nanhaiensis]|uniref:YqiJ family protein n=1 Tax=Shewanella nanhaiensis TaxID=2864872 RepID=A0ABS7E196_9GAMM|nr:YqiJ family protein [Shewanella nanhaiensis]MBW8183476.1 YqiJ family protein [Shewanella nanhaiensis]